VGTYSIDGQVRGFFPSIFFSRCAEGKKTRRTSALQALDTACNARERERKSARADVTSALHGVSSKVAGGYTHDTYIAV
jgi:hypothetical protein